MLNCILLPCIDGHCEKSWRCDITTLLDKYMQYDRTCSASCMFVSNNVMILNEIGRENVYNFKQRVTKSSNCVVNREYNFTRVSSNIWREKTMIVYCIY